jgi:hypothetical protein
MKYYKELLKKIQEEHGEELKGYFPQKKAIEFSGISFNTLKKWERAGIIKIKNIEGAVFVNKKDLQDHLKELEGRRDQRKDFLKYGFCLYLQEAKFLQRLIKAHATKEEKEAFANLSAKLETQVKRIKREKMKGEA